MNELMKRYEKDTGCSSTTIWRGEIVVSDKYVEWLENQVLDGKTIEKFQEIIRTQCDEISSLKAQLTWLPVSEKPEKEGWYPCKTQYADDTFGVETVFFNGKNFIFSSVIAWLPIPLQLTC